ncbi:MAG: right-handed parallel beta-helix repeat-containing protein [Aquabacterium sp.]|nr:right-handed parallel beta-helix repeat-containing protein [Aquabacterium sp.]
MFPLYQNQNRLPLALALALALTLGLAACGGGGSDSGGGSPESNVGSSSEALMQAAAVSVLAADAETIAVVPINGGNGIATEPVLTKANGLAVKTLEELPEGIANSAWSKKTTGRLPLRVVLGNGTYFLKTAWTWTPSQSGRADSPIYVEAQSTGGVVISGAPYVTVTKAVHAGATKVDVDYTGKGLANFEQLWVNGGRAVRARAPNLGGFYYVKKAVGSWSGSTSYDGKAVNLQAFGADPASLTYLNSLTLAQKQAAVLVAAQSWTTSHHRVQEVNGNNEVRVSPSANWPFLYTKFGFAQRYFIENVPSALDTAGEWYFAPSTSKLSFLPYPSQKLNDIVFMAPRVNQLLQLKGQVSTGKWVEYLNFKGLKFRYAHSPLPAAGYVDGQAAVAVEAAVQMDGVRNASVSDCEISRVGGYGVWLRANVRNVSVTGCEIYDTGAGGVKVGLGLQVADANATGYNTVQGNRIHATGFQFPGAVGVWIGQSSYNTVSKNLIGDTTYSGISVGWTWGYAASPAHHNVISQNFLYNLIQGSLSDGGGIYTLGASPGTVIKGNVIKNVRGFSQYGAGAWGLYNDEGTSNVVMDSNIVVGTDNGGYLMHYGLGNTVSNNVLANGDRAEIQVTKTEPNQQVSFDKNVLVPTMAGFISYGSTPAPLASFSGNVIAPQYVPTINSPAECGAGCTVASGYALRASALLDVPAISNGGRNVTLPSPVAGNWSTTPLTTYVSPSAWWGVSAANVPSRNFDFDAATADFGATPTGMVVVPTAHPELISVIRNGSGEKCLAFQDGAGLANAWEPYSFVETNFDAGATTVTFTLKADAGTEFIHEWRDYRGSPYKTGPRVVFSAARGVLVANQRVANLPVGQWVTVTVTSRQGAGQNWGLQLKYADNSTASFSNYAPFTTGWASTKSVLFISNASKVSTPCVGKLTIANQ